MESRCNYYFKAYISRAIPFLFILTAILALAGCDMGTSGTGGTPTPTPKPAQKTVDACKLVTVGEMGKIVGGQFTTALRTGQAAGEFYCVYKNTSNPSGPTPSIDLLTRDGQDAWKNISNLQTSDPTRYIATDVDGTQAIFEQQFSRLWVYKKTYTMIITVYLPSGDGTGSDSDKGMDLTKQLAQVALKRL